MKFNSFILGMNGEWRKGENLFLVKAFSELNSFPDIILLGKKYLLIKCQKVLKQIIWEQLN